MKVTCPVKILRDMQRRDVLVGRHNLEETYRVYALEGWIPVAFKPDKDDPKSVKVTFERPLNRPRKSA